MNFSYLQNSILSVLTESTSGSVRELANEIMAIVSVELWTRTTEDTVYLADLTDFEYRVVSTWALENREAYGTSRIRCIRDMREVFPGLSLSAASKLVK